MFHTRKQGLTIVELLVVMVLLSSLFMGLYSLFRSGLQDSFSVSMRAELDTETQKVQQLIVSRVKEAREFLKKTDVTFNPAVTAYAPAATLTNNQMIIVEVPDKNDISLCMTYAYYPVPTTTLSSDTVPMASRLVSNNTNAVALVQASTSTTSTCNSPNPVLNVARVVHPSLRSVTGFVAVPSIPTGSVTQNAVNLTMVGFKSGGKSTVTTASYTLDIVARNIQ